MALATRDARARGTYDALGVKGIAVPLTDRDGKPYTAHVLTLTSGDRRGAGRTSTAVAALFVRKAALVIPSLSSRGLGRLNSRSPRRKTK